MGSLGSCDGMGLFLSWMCNSRTFKSGREDWRRKSGSIGVWNAFVTTSRCGLAVLAARPPLKLREYLLEGNRGGAAGSSFNWSIGTIRSGPWRRFLSGLGSPPDNKRSKIIVAGLGGGREGRASNSADDNGRRRGTLTAVILGLNILVFLGQIASKGRLLLWGAKINALIDHGQWWRLFTPAVLHANVFHLLINSYSLNSIGPTVESLTGPRRFLAVYSASALTSTTLSYFCSASPSVGASGAVFGVVGALAVFLLRHKDMMVGGQESLQRVARVIVMNLVLGLVSDGIDNWSHLGGLLGGAAVACLLGPVYTFQLPSGGAGGGSRQLVDRPPIYYLFPSRFRRD